MGGYGSGRTSYKQKAEDCRSLDVNRFSRDGCLQHGSRGNWGWSRDGQEIARIGFKAEQGRLVLDYKVRQIGGDWELITQPVPLTFINCHYGGQRPYFLCPGVVNGRHCGRQVGRLFLGGRYFLCRRCNNITYSSQSEAQCDRMLRKANKTRMALGGEPGTASWIPFKPKGMWQRTYDRHHSQILRDEGQANQLFLSKFAHLLSREEQEMYFGA